jgi:hypothetical protein
LTPTSGNPGSGGEEGPDHIRETLPAQLKKRATHGSFNHRGTIAGSVCVATTDRIRPTLIGRFSGRAIRDISHAPPAGFPFAANAGLPVELRIIGVRQLIRYRPVRSRPMTGRLSDASDVGKLALVELRSVSAAIAVGRVATYP